MSNFIAGSLRSRVKELLSLRPTCTSGEVFSVLKHEFKHESPIWLRSTIGAYLRQLRNHQPKKNTEEL